MRFRRHSSGKASSVWCNHRKLNLERGATIVEGEEEEEAIDGRFPEEVLLFIIILSHDCFKLQSRRSKLSRYGNKGKEVS